MDVSGDFKRATGVVQWVTKALESVGLLNKGSSTTSATPKPDENASTVGVSTNSLNVTRVGGMSSLTIAVGTAALTLFQLNNKTSSEARAAAYLAVGIMVAAALVATAVILQSDVRSRTKIEVSAQAETTNLRKSDIAFRAGWCEIIASLEFSLILAIRAGRDAPFHALELARETVAASGVLQPSSAHSMVHAQLVALQYRVVAGFTELASETQTRDATLHLTEEAFPVLESMRSLIKGLG
jgi:hypothetical protein